MMMTTRVSIVAITGRAQCVLLKTMVRLLSSQSSSSSNDNTIDCVLLNVVLVQQIKICLNKALRSSWPTGQTRRIALNQL